MLIMLMMVKVGQDCCNSAESGGNNHFNNSDSNGFAIVTLTMEVKAQSQIDDGEKGDALTKAALSAVREVGYVELELCTWILEVKEGANGP